MECSLNVESEDSRFYPTYAEFISLIKDTVSLPERRVIREEFLSRSPASNEFWLEWIDDEMSGGEQDYDQALTLLERAAHDLNNINIWNIYVDLFSALKKDPGEIRLLFDEALKCCGHHVTRSHGLWEKARQFEFAQEVQDSRRISRLFTEEMGVPTKELEDVFMEFFEWSGGRQVNKLNESRRVLQTLLPFEDRLESSLEAFDDYLEANSHVSAIKRRQNILERLLERFPGSERHWSLYIQLLVCRYDSMAHLGRVSSVVRQANLRFPRNASFWVYRIQLLCGNDSLDSFDEFKNVFQSASSIQFTQGRDYKGLHMAAILFYKMRGVGDPDQALSAVLEMCEYSRDFFQTNFPGDVQSLGEILLFSAQLVSAWDMGNAREMMEAVVGSELRAHFRFWNEYYILERCHGDVATQRRVLKRAVSCVRDHVHLMNDLYVDFERLNGDCDTYWQAIKRVSLKTNTAHPSVDRTLIHKRKLSSAFPDTPAKKRAPSDIPAKKGAPSDTPANKGAPSDIPANKGAPSETERTDHKEARTVFLSNLSYTVTSDEIVEMFVRGGVQPRDVRIVGEGAKHRGFAYVEFSSPEAVSHALVLDRTTIDSRPVFVSSYGSRNSEFAYTTELDRKKLFIKNLPAEMDSSGLERMISESRLSGVRGVRLVTRKSGKSKRVAYIDFDREDLAQAGLELLSGMKVDGFTLDAFFSNPPAKPSGDDLPVVRKKSVTTRQKTKIDFVPRSVRRAI